MSDTVGNMLQCCGRPVDIDGYCQQRSHHRRQVTPELFRRAFDAASTGRDLRAQVLAVLEEVL